MRILFLEDNDLFAESLMDFLDPLHWDFTRTQTVDEAKQIFDGRELDLIIMDLHLRTSLRGSSSSGLDLLFYVRKRKHSQIPVVVTTGLELIERDEILRYGADLFFYKSSIDMTEFVRDIRGLVFAKKVQ